MNVQAPVRDASLTAERHPPASELIAALAAQGKDGKISIGEMLSAFGERAFGVLLILFALPNLVPIPILPALFGWPLLFVAFQMACGRERPRLPKFIERKTIERRTLVRCLTAVEPRVKRIETVLKPRMTYLFTPRMEKVLGWFGVGAAISIIFPFPGTNFPPALGLIVAALALAEEDGRVLAVGLGILAVALTYTLSVMIGLAYFGSFATMRLLGF